jgi:hypothetical protein
VGYGAARLTHPTIFNATWIVPAAIAMAIFYALAGGKHVLNTERTASESWALWSDLWATVFWRGGLWWCGPAFSSSHKKCQSQLVQKILRS